MLVKDGEVIGYSDGFLPDPHRFRPASEERVRIQYGL